MTMPNNENDDKDQVDFNEIADNISNAFERYESAMHVNLSQFKEDLIEALLGGNDDVDDSGAH